MQTKIGIVGLPNVGKSTLFKILTKQDITIANYPFATIDPNVGVVAVPDARVDQLAALSRSRKKIPAVVEFFDIAGLVKGASQNLGMGNKFLEKIKETQAIVLVVRVFQDTDIIHVENSVDPARDLDIVMTELILKDLETVEKRLVKVEAEARAGRKEAIAERDELIKIKKLLEDGKPADHTMGDLNLLTAKRRIFLLNGEEGDVTEDLENKMKEFGGDHLVANLAAADIESSAVANLIRKAYEVLGLASFFTTGEDETRAWTIERDSLAPQAAGVIHTDFEKKFIRMEVVACDRLLEAGGWTQAKQKGWLRVEGKDYAVQDGDVVEVRHG